MIKKSHITQYANVLKSLIQILQGNKNEISKLLNSFGYVYYDIDGPQMIPALYRSDEYGEQGINFASNHAILDDGGRVMVLINWNSDMGDGWEHTYHSAYPTRYANSAYRLGINYLMYSMTH